MFNTSVWKLIFLKETIFPSEGCVKTLWWCTGMSFYNIRNKAKIKIVTFISTSSRSSLITYIHNWSLQPFSQVYNLYSHRTYVVCVNFMHGWRDFWEAFHGNFIYSESFYQKSTEKKSPKKYFHIFVLMSGIWTQILCLITQSAIY